MHNETRIEAFLEGVSSIAIAGHVNPDGDCIGSCLGLWNYLQDNYPAIQSFVYLESYREVFSYLKGMEQVRSVLAEQDAVDLLILVDISSKDRVGVAGPLLERAKNILCFDHHVTNTEPFTWLFNDPEASSTCEVIFRFLSREKISAACAEALYIGIVHDTGVFQYSSTSPDTMRTAAFLMEKGIPFAKRIDETYYQKTYAQNQIMGKTVLESSLYFEGRLILGAVSLADRTVFGVEPKDMDGIVNELRNTIGTEIAVFLYELEPDRWKVSLRSRDTFDVSRVAQRCGGGGHVRAAGCTLQGTLQDVKANILQLIGEDL